MPQGPGWSQYPITCRTENYLFNHVKVVLKGMCSNTKFDTEYVLNWIPADNNPDPSNMVKWWYQGKRNSTIIYIGERKWVLSDSQFHFMTEAEKKTISMLIIFQADRT